MQLKRGGMASGILFLAVLGCGKAPSRAPVTHPAPTAAATSAKDAERVVERCTERWKKIAAEDWIVAYDFQTPATRKTQTLADYLMGKSIHKYEKPEPPELLELQPDRAFIYVACLWTPTHPALHEVKLEPGQSLTEHLEMVETWRKTEGQWYFASSQAILEFFNVNPGVKRPTPRQPTPGG